MTQPARLTFWRILLAAVSLLALFSAGQLLALAARLGTAPLTSKSWLAALGVLALVGLGSLLLLGLTWSPSRPALLDRLEWGSRVGARARRLGLPLLVASLGGYSVLIFHSYYTDLLRSQNWVCLFFFLLLGILGMQALEMLRPDLSWPGAFLAAILLELAVYRIALYLPEISTYPFAMGWSETSRFYWPSLFVSRQVYGQQFPWPILHPTLHLTLVPPYLFDAPLWFHRFWQVGMRLLLVGLVAPALLWRLKIADRALRWVFGVWVFVYLFTLPLYLHLAVPVFVMLWGFSATDRRRAWLALVLASVWAGLSRLNWYPVPGILAAVLFLLEVPYQGQGLGRYLRRPAIWFVAGTFIAFVVQRAYIALSGIANAGDFYTSLSSSLLLNRLWPNASYPFGIVLGAVIFSAGLWLLIAWFLRKRGGEIHPLRILLIGLALLVLFLGGIVVSLKIGGGADLHNMDAYAVLLMIVCASLFFGHYAPESGQPVQPPAFPWTGVALAVIIPLALILQTKASFMRYDPLEARATLAGLQERVNNLDAGGAPVLFITQRHLIAMHMLSGVGLVPEYEREELMEMAMANNQAYLQTFYSDLQNHRFAAIIVDPLQVNYLGSGYPLGEENDAWDRRVAKPILCNYREDLVFPDDHIVIYVPQAGTPRCP